VACLLEAGVRTRIWSGIQSGRDAESLRRIATSSPEPPVPESAMDAPETEGTDIEPTEPRVTESEPPSGEHPIQPPVEAELQRTRRPDITGPGGV
jgi:hypothetical protein